MKHLLWAVAVPNFAMFWLVGGGAYFNAAFLLSSLGALICLHSSYVSLRKRDSCVLQASVISASVFLFPLTVILLWNLFIVLASIGHLGEQIFPIQFYFPYFGSYYLIPTYVGISYICISAVLLILAWCQKPSGLFYRFLFSIYTVILFIYAGYIAWWHFTHQRFEYM